jgi:hypothetical protein
MNKHRHNEWRKFLQLIEKNVSTGQEIHIICDNYSTHKHVRVKAWLAKRSHIHIHFTPTSASWLNMMERFFRDLTDKCVRRGVFHHVAELERAIYDYIDSHNEAPAPFIWTAQASDILEKVKRGRAKLNNLLFA